MNTTKDTYENETQAMVQELMPEILAELRKENIGLPDSPTEGMEEARRAVVTA